MFVVYLDVRIAFVFRHSADVVGRGPAGAEHTVLYRVQLH